MYIDDSVKDLIIRLEITSVCRQFPVGFNFISKPALENKEINILLGFSTILSLSDESSDLSLSYEIVTRLLEYTEGKSEKTITVANLVLSRIGNFPGRSLLQRRHSKSLRSNISPIISFECLAREAENTFFLDDERSSLLTDFQYKFLMSIGENYSLSVSAPTSAGKSFVLNLDLIRSINSSVGQCIVYLVPTRALISEVASRIRMTLRENALSEVVVRTAPFPIAKEKIKKAAVYVLTQERLMSFFNASDVEPFISSLIVDEAHEIQNGKRGVILQNSIDIALSRFPAVKVLFASPLIKNPAYFLSLFGRNLEGKYFVEEVSPVSQNIILIEEVYKKPKEIDICFLSNGDVVPVSRVKTDFPFRGSACSQRAAIVIAISRGEESVISFSNGPSDAEKVAKKIAGMSRGFEPTDDILSFVDFIRTEIHKDYPLADCIIKGVAFHYGNMPSLIRAGVESLFKSGQIKIICCTSTLLQGVNLPAKHIVIEDPMSGDSPMSRANFLNLSGRAGRLLQEFHGNIWCIRPAGWGSDCYKGERLQEITSAVSEVMKDGGISIQNLLKNGGVAQEGDDVAEAAFSKLYHDYMIDPELDFYSKYKNESNADDLEETILTIRKVEVTFPINILENHQSLRPDHLQRLYESLKSIDSIRDAVPLSPYLEGAKVRMEEILTVLADAFDWKLSDRYKSWVSYLAYKWIWGEPIGRILSDRISYLKSISSTENLSSIIRSCLKVIEEAIRFRMVKYFSAYIDMLKEVAAERGLDEELGGIEPYHIYLEFGSCNRHALNLMALGISRFTALYMQSKFDFSEDVEPEEYLECMSTMNINSFNMPNLCKKEILDYFP
ncbi:DEAD/DEAH box helicase [Thalassolituus oleivorans]|uniref:DEAD/DEAH box helicase n=1 Tax=Thalassolituus oleivorans TaxID=187493 RepID=UPI00240A2F2B|nr:DEAD/DEAH box helicase [Thalassolituus oleivorans]MDF1641548.1 DEAD/DEAH box helicase [Thalassolituus oleivorans]